LSRYAVQPATRLLSVDETEATRDALGGAVPERTLPTRTYGRVVALLAAVAVLAGATPEPRSPLQRPGPGAGAAGQADRGEGHRDSPGAGPPARARQGSGVDGDRLLDRLRQLREFGGTDAGGTHRVAYSPEDLAAREYVSGLMREAGLEVSTDLAGNLVGTRPGTEPGLAPLMLGSHIDTVPDGGSFDGTVGSMAAIEAVLTLHEAGIDTRHPLEVLIFQNEEGGKTGSRALVGEVEPDELDLVTASGNTIRKGIRLLGGDPRRLEEARRRPGSVAAYLELHVEQGAVLETADIDVGVVEGIVGIKRWTVTLEGFTNHAGTTPMEVRRDALVGAARFIREVDRVARQTPGRQVATVGRISASPGAPNVIPGRVTLSLEIRDLEMDKIDAVYGEIRDRAEGIREDSGVTFSFDRFYVSRAAPTDPRIRELVTEAAEELGLSTLQMPSGAGHDAQSIARLGPVGMIFVPSVNGISHSPREYSEPEDIVAGADVLLQTLLKLDAAAWLTPRQVPRPRRLPRADRRTRLPAGGSLHSTG